jgi:4'-phosphopantetheinyl transferase
MTPEDLNDLQCRLGEGEIHVWNTSTEMPSNTVEKLVSFLSPEEKARADRFHFEKDQLHFKIGRGMLRCMLGKYLQAAPEKIEFAFNQQGKPMLVETSGELSPRHPIHFSVSHSQGMVLWAFKASSRVGIDVEFHKARIDHLELAKRFFAHDEAELVASLPEHESRRTFFKIWTLKEAFIKAHGGGLSVPLDSFSVDPMIHRGNQLCRLDLPEHSLENWTVKSLEFVPENYSAAVAWEDSGAVVHCRWNC